MSNSSSMAGPDEVPPPAPPKPAAIDIKKLQADLERALAASGQTPAPTPLIRYTLADTSALRKGVSNATVGRPDSLATASQPLAATPVDPPGRWAYIPFPVITDILQYDTKRRALHWLSRALVRDTAGMVPQMDIYGYYQHCFIPYAATHPVLPTAELLDLLLKIFKGSRNDTITGRVQAGVVDTYVIRNVAWRGQPAIVEKIGVEVLEEKEQATNPLGFGAAERPGATPAVATSIGSGAETVGIDSSAPATTEQLNQAATSGLDDLDDDHIAICLQMTFADKCAGRKLAHLPEPARTRYWLRMFFKHGSNVEIEEAALWMLYEQTFNPYYDERPHLDDVQFVARITKVFKDAEEVEVGPEHRVIWGIKPRKKRMKALVLLKKYAEEQTNRAVRHLDRMAERKDFELRVNNKHRGLNRFQEMMLLWPLLALPAGEPSPWLQRLQRRAGGEPLGDHQPGFPGVSMKRLASEYRRDYEARRKMADETIMRAAAEGAPGVAVAQALDEALDRYPPPGPATRRALNADGEGHTSPSRAKGVQASEVPGRRKSA
ncbi:hypothetical protein LTR36_001646 [Oleoguttula mirabilis]|uniref:Uncharacterized protein n=1 Tax=Oleoguttula mirabilis TaxID=1507867 RepID=A0AAV9JP38_9PEZI|nr:hypothetical protein LTR36_001646 [Oleoguttula mirabilis]